MTVPFTRRALAAALIGTTLVAGSVSASAAPRYWRQGAPYAVRHHSGADRALVAGAIALGAIGLGIAAASAAQSRYDDAYAGEGYAVQGYGMAGYPVGRGYRPGYAYERDDVVYTGSPYPRHRRQGWHGRPEIRDSDLIGNTYYGPNSR